VEHREASERRTARAMRALERPESIEPRAILHGYRRALRIWEYPPKGEWAAWTAFVHSKQPRIATRVVRWKRDGDLDRAEMTNAASDTSEATPTLHVADGIVPSEDFDLLVDLASRLRLPALGFRRAIGNEGTTWGVTFEVGLCRATFEGWDREPDAWSELLAWSERMRALLQRSIDA
jgi:hypothetical protein